ncbi:MAG: YHS domain-containing protein [Desulfatiglandales bacterium]|jgi:YHS domain-containing protein
MNHWKKIFLAIGLLVAFAFGASVYAAEEPNQINCPVMQGPANKNIYTDYQGKRIYFCCPPCIQQFKKDPDKYMKQFEKEGIVLEDAPAAKKP